MCLVAADWFESNSFCGRIVVHPTRFLQVSRRTLNLGVPRTSGNFALKRPMKVKVQLDSSHFATKVKK